MSNFGTKGFMTLEPNNSTQEEAISFTGVTQNANGTATLTGVSNVSFVYPYTETSGLGTAHPGGAAAIITNTAQFYDQFVNKDSDGTINQDLTFAAGATPSITDAPATPTEAANKGYVDSVAIAGAPNATTAVQGLVQLGSQSAIDGKQSLGSTGASLTVKPSQLRATKYHDYLADTGTVNAYAITPVPAVTQYVAGLEFRFKAATANTSAATLNVGGIGAKTIKKNKNLDLVTGDITTNYIAAVIYDATTEQFQLIETAPPKISISSKEIYATSTTGNTAWAVALSPAATAYTAGLVVNFKPDTGGGHPTLNVNGLGAKNVYTYRSGTLGAANTGDIVANQLCTVIYDGTQFQLQSNLATPINYAASTHTRGGNTASGSQVLAHGLGKLPNKIKITANWNSGAANWSQSFGVYTGYTRSIFNNNLAPSFLSGVSTTNIITLYQSDSLSQIATIDSLDATNVTLSWTRTGGTGGDTIYILIEAE